VTKLVELSRIPQHCRGQILTTLFGFGGSGHCSWHRSLVTSCVLCLLVHSGSMNIHFVILSRSLTYVFAFRRFILAITASSSSQAITTAERPHSSSTSRKFMNAQPPVSGHLKAYERTFGLTPQYIGVMIAPRGQILRTIVDMCTLRPTPSSSCL